MQRSETVVSTLVYCRRDRKLNNSPVKKLHRAMCVEYGVETFMGCDVSLKTAEQVGLNALMYHGTNFTDTCKKGRAVPMPGQAQRVPGS